MSDAINDAGVRARSGILWMGSTSIIWQLVNWGLTILTARYLSPTDYGVVALAETLIPYLWIIASLSTNIWVIQNPKLEAKALGTIWVLQIGLGIITTALAYFAAPSIAEFYASPLLVAPLQALSFLFVLHSAWGLAEALLEREMEFRQVALMNVVISIARGVIQVTLAVQGWGFWALVVGMLSREIFACLWMLVFRRFRWTVSFDFQTCLAALRFGIPTSGSSVLWILSHTIDNVIVGKLFGPQVLGYYAMAFYLTDLPLAKLNAIIRPVIVPYFSRLQAERERLHRAFSRTLRAVSFLIFPTLIGFGVVADSAVPILLGEQWVPMVPYLRLMCWVGVIRAAVDNISPLLTALGEAKRLLLANIVNVLVMPLGFYLLGSMIGIDGIFLGWLVLFPMVSWILIQMLERAAEFSARQYFDSMLRPLLLSIVMGCGVILVGFFFRDDRLMLRFGAQIAVGAVLYGFLSWIFLRDSLNWIFARRLQVED